MDNYNDEHQSFHQLKDEISTLWHGIITFLQEIRLYLPSCSLSWQEINPHDGEILVLVGTLSVRPISVIFKSAQ
jgi:hypothetical protein